MFYMYTPFSRQKQFPLWNIVRHRDIFKKFPMLLKKTILALVLCREAAKKSSSPNGRAIKA